MLLLNKSGNFFKCILSWKDVFCSFMYRESLKTEIYENLLCASANLGLSKMSPEYISDNLFKYIIDGKDVLYKKKYLKWLGMDM